MVTVALSLSHTHTHTHIHSKPRYFYESNQRRQITDLKILSESEKMVRQNCIYKD